MFCKSIQRISSLTFALALGVAGIAQVSGATLTAVEIVDRNVASRGGLQAWRAVQTMSFSGKLGVGGNQRGVVPTGVEAPSRRGAAPLVPARPAEEIQLPFVMELKRPRKLRFELEFKGQVAVQVYDGNSGWKIRPYLNRREVEAYTPDEMRTASLQADLDGPLVDYAAKGTKIELAGSEKVEDRDTYKLKLTLKTGQVIHVWIDTQTFLEAKIEGSPRRMDGVDHPVEVYFRDYRPVSGLQIPFVLETRVLPVAKTTSGYAVSKPIQGTPGAKTPATMADVPVPPEKVIIEKVVVNPKLEEARFSKPEIQMASTAK